MCKFVYTYTYILLLFQHLEPSPLPAEGKMGTMQHPHLLSSLCFFQLLFYSSYHLTKILFFSNDSADEQWKGVICAFACRIRREITSYRQSVVVDTELHQYLRVLHSNTRKQKFLNSPKLLSVNQISIWTPSASSLTPVRP